MIPLLVLLLLLFILAINSKKLTGAFTFTISCFSRCRPSVLTRLTVVSNFTFKQIFTMLAACAYFTVARARSMRASGGPTIFTWLLVGSFYAFSSRLAVLTSEALCTLTRTRV